VGTEDPYKDIVSREVLSYLVEHPKAQDTLEGILEWWLTERLVKHQMPRVQGAIESLVGYGLVIEHEVAGSQSTYQVNPEKYSEIKTRLDKMKGAS